MWWAGVRQNSLTESTESLSYSTTIPDIYPGEMKKMFKQRHVQVSKVNNIISTKLTESEVLRKTTILSFKCRETQEALDGFSGWFQLGGRAEGPLGPAANLGPHTIHNLCHSFIPRAGVHQQHP